MARQLSMKDTVLVADWLRKNQSELKNKTRGEAVDLLMADTGLVYSGPALARLAKSLGITLFDRKAKRLQTFTPGSWHNCVVVLAKSVIQIAEEAGIQLHHKDLLDLIVSRRTKEVKDTSAE